MCHKRIYDDLFRNMVKISVKISRILHNVTQYQTVLYKPLMTH